MKRVSFLLATFVMLMLVPVFASAQSGTGGAVASVPTLVRFSGVVQDARSTLSPGTTGVTFALYKEQQGGAALWIETQNVHVDSSGHYSVVLGASKPEGLPSELFTNGEARWLGVSVNGQAEQPRVLLLSVPYALKAKDAETVGGLPPSAFVLAAPPAITAGAANGASPGAAAQPLLVGTTPVTTAGGTTNKLAKFDATADIADSLIFDNGTNVGIGNTNPGARLDVSGTGIFRGMLSLPAAGTANATVGKNSQPFNLTASAFNSGTAKAVNQVFRWQAEPAGNNTASPSGTLNLLFGTGTAAPKETGLAISNTGLITFAPGQTFPGGGGGTITGVTAGTDLTGGGSSGVVTLNLDTTKVPQLNTPNTFTQLQTINNQVLIKTTVGGQALIAFGTGGPSGIQGNTDSSGGFGVVGNATSSTGNAVGVAGGSLAPSGTGGSFQGATGVVGQSFVCCAGVGGEFVGATPPSGSSANATLGVVGVGGNSGLAVASDGAGGLFQGGSKGIHGDGIDVVAGSGFAGNFFGDLNVSGAVIAGTKDFKIDHPADPANKYLVHASVESSEMMNIYTGNVTTDARGEAVVNLPEWFETLNGDFRYQLTVMGQFAQAIVSSKISDHRFTIRTDKPNVEVSWQVTGVRHDPFAKAHPLVVEEQKDTRLRGFYIHPELYGAPEEKQIEWARHPETMKKMRARQLAASQAATTRADTQPLAVPHDLIKALPPESATTRPN